MKVLRRGTALVLSLVMMFGLVAVVASPNWSNATSLGLLSRYYETGNTDTTADAAKMISTVAGDIGGKSYGAYMFASNTGTVKNFVDWCMKADTSSATYGIGEKLYRAYYSNGEGCGPLFDQAWIEVASDYASSFFTTQEAFVKSQIYDKAIDLIHARVPDFNVNNYSVALQNVIWSRAVHHGPEGACNIVVRAFNRLGGFANQSERAIIMAIYDESGRVVDAATLSSETNGGKARATMDGALAAKYDVDGEILRYWYGSSAGVQLSVYRRLNVNEPADALSMLQKNAFKNATLSEGNYTISRKDASSLVLSTNGSAVKLVNTAGDPPGTPAKFTLSYLPSLNAYTIEVTVTDNNASSVKRLAASTADGSGFGTVTPEKPSASYSQLWVIDSDGNVKNKATGTYLACRNDTLVVVGADGANTTQSVKAVSNGRDDQFSFTRGDDKATPTDLKKTLNVTFVTGEQGAIASGSNATFDAGSKSDFVATALPTVTAKSGWQFDGWVTADGKDVKVGTEAAAGTLVLYAKYTVTSEVSPAKWTFSPVAATAADITVVHHLYPSSSSTLHQNNSSFPVRGMISCSEKISSVALTVKNSSGKTVSYASDTASPNDYYYDLSRMDSTVSYSKLSAGEYTYTLTVTPKNGSAIEIVSSPFTVLAPIAEDERDDSTPTEGGTVSGGTDIGGNEIVNTEGFTVKFDAGSNGTASFSKKTYALDSIVYGKLPSVSVKNSSVEFVGWFTEDGVQILPGTQIIAENITLYAKYTGICTYKFLSASGGTYASGSAAAGTVFEAPYSAPVKAPDSDYTYSFSYWKDQDGNKYSSGQSIVMDDGGMTFTPVYTKKSYSSAGDEDPSKPSGPVWTLNPGTTISQMEGTVYSNGKVVSDGSVATGMIVKTDSGEYTVAVTGDTSGDGKISVTDVVRLQSHLLNKSKLSGAYLEAADLNGDGKVTITDLVKSARVVSGKDSIG